MNDQPCKMPCHACIEKFRIQSPGAAALGFKGLLLNSTRMIVCEHCGNKRCPHASNHELACTGSNEPGQEGSIY